MKEPVRVICKSTYTLKEVATAVIPEKDMFLNLFT